MVAEQVAQVPGAGVVAVVSGRFDLVVLLESTSPADLGRTIVEDIQGLPDVTATETLFCLEAQIADWL